MKKQTQFDSLYNRPPQKIRKISKKSETVPGEAYTVLELYQRAVAQGQLTSGTENYMDVPLEKIGQLFRVGMDLTDLDELKKHNRKLTKELKAFEDAKLKAEKENAKKAEKEALRKELEAEAKLKEAEQAEEA